MTTQTFTNTKAIIFSLALGLTLAAGITFAWNAVWHGTGWIDSGEEISSQKVAENFEYLYARSPNCPKGDYLVSTGDGWECDSGPTTTTPPTPPTTCVYEGTVRTSGFSYTVWNACSAQAPRCFCAFGSATCIGGSGLVDPPGGWQQHPKVCRYGTQTGTKYTCQANGTFSGVAISQACSDCSQTTTCTADDEAGGTGNE